MSTLGLRAAKINDLDKAADIITSQAENQTFTMNMLPSVQFLPPRLFPCYVLFLLGFALCSCWTSLFVHAGLCSFVPSGLRSLFLLGFALCSCWASLFCSFTAFSTKSVNAYTYVKEQINMLQYSSTRHIKSNLNFKIICFQVILKAKSVSS